jgi:hypothetical protein
MAKLVPVFHHEGEIFGFFKDKGTITGDVVSPILTLREWGNLA